METSVRQVIFADEEPGALVADASAAE